MKSDKDLDNYQEPFDKLSITNKILFIIDWPIKLILKLTIAVILFVSFFFYKNKNKIKH